MHGASMGERSRSNQAGTVRDVGSEAAVATQARQAARHVVGTASRASSVGSPPSSVGSVTDTAAR